MLEHDKIYEDFARRHLLPAEWEQRKREIMRGAKEAHSRALRDLFVHSLSAIQTAAETGRELALALSARTARAAARLADAYSTWRSNRRAVRELHALGDRTLKDFGIHRSEIESVVYGRDSSRVTEGRIAARLLHKPYAQRSNGASPAVKQSARKNAA